MFDHNDIIKKLKLNNTGELNKNRVIYYKYPTPLHYANEYSGIQIFSVIMWLKFTQTATNL